MEHLERAEAILGVARPDWKDQLDAELEGVANGHARLWFVSDTHFAHERICEIESRPFPDVAASDAAIVDRWNAAVAPHDVVLRLGDLALGSIAESMPRTAALAGHRFLIPGNHDRVSPACSDGRYMHRQRDLYEDAGWTILPGIVPLSLGSHLLLVSHYPFAGGGDTQAEERHDWLRPYDLGLPLVHGHIHSGGGRPRATVRMFNVSVEANAYRPVPASEILVWLDRVQPALGASA